MKPTLYLVHSDKWYRMYVDRGGLNELEAVEFDELERVCLPGQSPYVDHVPNPRVFVALAKAKGWEVDYLSLEKLIGRWELEACHNYDDLELP